VMATYAAAIAMDERTYISSIISTDQLATSVLDQSMPIPLRSEEFLPSPRVLGQITYSTTTPASSLILLPSGSFRT
jgi:hypothetical protein